MPGHGIAVGHQAPADLNKPLREAVPEQAVYLAHKSLRPGNPGTDWQIENLYRLYAVVDINSPNFGRELLVKIDSKFVSGLFFGGVAKYPNDSIAGDAYNPQQDVKNNELNDEANKQSQQEAQLWQNVNTYKSQLDFGLNSWSDAAGGLDYVTDVFLLIWNNSPTQIITLSLMLGIGMLAIGRGVMAARRQAKDDT